MKFHLTRAQVQELVSLFTTRHDSLDAIPNTLRPHSFWLRVAGFLVPNHTMNLSSRPIYHPKILFLFIFIVIRTAFFIWSVYIYVRDPSDATMACLTGDWTLFLGRMRHLILFPFTLACVLVSIVYLNVIISHEHYQLTRRLHIQ